MMLVGMSDPGLLILPTHRLVSGFPGLTADDARRAARARVRGRPTSATGEAGCRAAWEAIEDGGDQDVLGFGTVADGRWLLARLRSDDGHGPARPDAQPRLAQPGRERAPRPGARAPPGEPLGDAVDCRYVHLLGEVLDDVAARGCDLACLVPPARMEHVESIASNLETMPPKSTYFYPKLLSGLVLNPLR